MEERLPRSALRIHNSLEIHDISCITMNPDEYKQGKQKPFSHPDEFLSHLGFFLLFYLCIPIKRQAKQHEREFSKGK